MQITDVINISRQGIFTLSEAKDLLPIIRRFTSEYAQMVDTMISGLDALDSNATVTIRDLETQINEHIKEWHVKIRKLGGHPKGLWLVDFDAGDGYFCWKHPEQDILFWHSYTDGFTKRVPLVERPVSTTAETQEESPVPRTHQQI